MPRVTLTYDLPDEEEGARDAMQATELRRALDEIDCLAREALKHGNGLEWERALGEILAVRQAAHDRDHPTYRSGCMRCEERRLRHE